MSTLAVLAHYDPQGLVAPHVRRYAEALAGVSDRLLIVSTAPLTAASRRELGDLGELLERRNEGYDFLSWKHGLEHAGDWQSLDRLVLANDSVVGPLRPLADVLGTVGDGRRVNGVVVSEEHGPHLRRFLMAFGPAVLRDPVFAAFWLGMTPLKSRAESVLAYEVGLGRLLRFAGYPLEPYYAPGARDRMTLTARAARRAAGRAVSSRYSPLWTFSAVRRYPEDPMVSAWDAALDGRLPFVKLRTLRDDPARMGRERMLSSLEKAHPAEFAGVRAYIERTQGAYLELQKQEIKAGTVRRGIAQLKPPRRGPAPLPRPATRIPRAVEDRAALR